MVKLFYAYGEMCSHVEMANYLEDNEMLKIAGAQLLRYDCPDKKGMEICIPNARVQNVLDALMKSAKSWDLQIPGTLPQGDELYDGFMLSNIEYVLFEYALIDDILNKYAEITE